MTAEKHKILFSFLVNAFLWCSGNTDRGVCVERPRRQILRPAGGEQGMPAHLATYTCASMTLSPALRHAIDMYHTCLNSSVQVLFSLTFFSQAQTAQAATEMLGQCIPTDCAFFLA